MADSSKEHQNGKENVAGGDGTVTEQPVTSPEMAAASSDATTTATKLDTDEVK